MSAGGLCVAKSLAATYAAGMTTTRGHAVHAPSQRFQPLTCERRARFVLEVGAHFAQRGI